MGQGIIKIRDKYFIWSTVVDAPISLALSAEEVESWVWMEYGNEALKEHPARMERVEKTGTSYHGETLETLLACNRAGTDEKTISADEILEKFKDEE